LGVCPRAYSTVVDHGEEVGIGFEFGCQPLTRYGCWLYCHVRMPDRLASTFEPVVDRRLYDATTVRAVPEFVVANQLPGIAS